MFYIKYSSDKRVGKINYIDDLEKFQNWRWLR